MGGYLLSLLLLLLPARLLVAATAAPPSPASPSHESTDTPEPGLTTLDTLSEPVMSIIPDHRHKNTLHISCRCERGPETISLELLLGGRKLEERTVQRGEFANFTITVIPGTVRLQCRARSQDNQEAVSHKQMKINPDDAPPSRGEEKGEEREADAGQQFLIPLAFILTSVSSEVQKTNHMILAVCGPALLVLLLLIIIMTYLRNRRQDKAEARACPMLQLPSFY